MKSCLILVGGPVRKGPMIVWNQIAANLNAAMVTGLR